MPISAKSLTPREQERVRAALKDLADRYKAEEKTQTDLGRDLNVTQSTVSAALLGKPIGQKLAGRIAKLRGQSLDELLGGAPRPKVYADVPGWAEEADQAVARRAAPRSVVRAIARLPASIPLERADWRFIAELAGLYLRWAPAEDREAAETEDAVREMEDGRAPKPEAPQHATPVKVGPPPTRR